MAGRVPLEDQPPIVPTAPAGTLPGTSGGAAPMPSIVADRYEVLRELGKGGMGRVYVAHDRKLGRDVAVKVLAPGGAHSEEVLARFEQEARATGSLNHPNILSVHDVGLWQGGPYLVSELLEGETLRETLRRGPLEPEEAASLALQLARGLAAAHEKGIVHRDLKPENLFVTSDGRLKILDFGIAKLVTPTDPEAKETPAVAHTRTGAIIGTVGYMSPEQLRGRRIDHRSDLFSCGAVLHEMLTGRPAFDRDTPVETGYAILNEEVPVLPVSVPSRLARIVRHCLEKKPQDRFQSARDLLFELQGLTGGTGDRLRLSRRAIRFLRWTVGGVLAAAGAAYVALRLAAFLSGRVLAPGASVAVLPFADLSPGKDQEYFSDGLAEEILDTLAHIEGLRVTGRTSSFSFKGKNEDVQSIGRKLNVAAILEGSIRKEGDRLRVTAQLIGAADGFHLWSQTFDRQVTGIFAVQEEIAAAVVQALRVRLLPGAAASPPSRKTSPEAHAQYLIGRQLLNRGSADAFSRAEAAFGNALALDSRYAPAWIGAAHAAYLASNLPVSEEAAAAAARRAIEAAEKAVKLGPELGESWAVRGWLRGLLQWDWAGAESDLKKALQLSAGDAVVWRRYGFLLANLGRVKEALSAVRKSADLDPLAAEAWDNLAYLSNAAGDYAGARAAAAKALQIAPEQAYAADHVPVADLLEGHPAAALEKFARSAEEVFRLQGIAMAQFDLGRTAESQRALDELTAKYARNQAFQIAQVYAWRGDADRAFEWLTRGRLQRDGGVAFVKCDPLLGKIRSDPRYAKLVGELGFPD